MVIGTVRYFPSWYNFQNILEFAYIQLPLWGFVFSSLNYVISEPDLLPTPNHEIVPWPMSRFHYILGVWNLITS
jgi:hypothetical protein